MDDTRFRILFLPIPEQKASTNRLHLDLTATTLEDQNETTRTLVERLGGRDSAHGKNMFAATPFDRTM